MARALRVDIGDEVYHVINRAERSVQDLRKGSHMAGSRGVAGWSSGTILRTRSASLGGRRGTRPQKYQ